MKTYLAAYKIHNNKKQVFWCVEGRPNTQDSGIFTSFEFLRMRYSKCENPDDLKITMHDTEHDAYAHLDSKGIILNEIEKAFYWKPRK